MLRCSDERRLADTDPKIAEITGGNGHVKIVHTASTVGDLNQWWRTIVDNPPDTLTASQRATLQKIDARSLGPDLGVPSGRNELQKEHDVYERGYKGRYTYYGAIMDYGGTAVVEILLLVEPPAGGGADLPNRSGGMASCCTSAKPSSAPRSSTILR